MGIAEAGGNAERIAFGRFVDASTEAAFRVHSWLDWSSRLRIVSLAGAILFGAFAYTDYLALAPGRELYFFWSLRALLLAVAIATARLTLGAPRPAVLDLATLGLLLMFALTLVLVIALQNRSLLFQAPGVILMALAFYVFVPARFDIQLVASLAVSGGALLLSRSLPGTGYEEMVVGAGELLTCNLIGAFTALRAHTSQRRDYLRVSELQRRARFEELVARLSTRFITAPIAKAESLIFEALGEAGEFMDADRVWVFEFDHDQKIANCLQEWNRAGIRPALRAFQRVPFDAFSWAFNQIVEGHSVVTPRMAELPPEAAIERAEAERHGVRSMIVLPLLFGRRVLGAIGAHAVRGELEWGGEREAMLRMVGEMIMSVLAHRRSRDQLASQSVSLNESMAALEKTNAELEQFAHLASHDLQEPLRSISSFSSLLSERYAGRLDASADEYLGYLRTAAHRMHELVTSLLGYSGLAHSGGVVERLDAGAVLREALARVQRQLDEAGAELLTSPMPVVQGDHGQLVLVFQHLLDNAVKFRGPLDPRIVIGVQRASEFWEFSVNDNGIGVEPRHIERIFQPFTRLHAIGKYPGTGIGLAVARRVIERHGGQIWVESDGTHGSTVRFTLPAAE